jgi:hypothetical protein
VSLLFLVLACQSGFSDPSREMGPPLAPESPRHAEAVDRAPSNPTWTTRLAPGEPPAALACGTCHGTPSSKVSAPPFHADVSVLHGSLSCNQCHAPQRQRLHLADATELEFADTMRLCAQCHGSQYRDFTHGAHGGMAGFWDEGRGARTRRNCVSCHAPHNPAFQGFLPVPLPPDPRHGDG